MILDGSEFEIDGIRMDAVFKNNGVNVCRDAGMGACQFYLLKLT